jgi:outer membrane protein OmpA-like peptidoglycan-associated protein
VIVPATRAVALALLGAAAAARADTAIDAQLYKPALDGFGVFATEGAHGPAQYDVGLRAGVGYAAAPLRLAVEHIGSPEDKDEVLESQLTVGLGLSFGVTDWLTFALDVPLQVQPLGAGYGVDGRYRPVDPADESMFQPGTGFYSVRPDQNLDPSENTPGDPRVGLKARFLAAGGFAFAAQLVAHAPFGDEDVFAGSKGFTFEPKLIVERRLGARGTLALNLGARLREGTLAETRQVSTDGYVRNDASGQPVFRPLLYVGSEAIVALGARVALGRRLALGVEGFALIPISRADDMDCPDGCRNGDLTADALGGLFLSLTDDTTLIVAGGAGVVPDAARRDAFRVVGAVSWAPSAAGGGGARGDRDGDGINDRDDLCADEGEDRDGFQDDDGCPDPDNDLDGIADARDQCPREPEDRDGVQDGDGCPDVDDDGDGVADLNDRCPREKEDADGFQDGDGCPDPDNDGDGILDKDDRCPNEPETVNAVDDMDGCPDQSVQGGPRMAADRIDLQGERIEFVGRTARPTAATLRTLDAVAAVMKQYPTVRIRIEVGVERSGAGRRARAADQRLSAQRATAVAAYLASKGVRPAQLDAAPLGSDRPIDARNPRDPRLNRRVELIRVTQ